MELILVVNKYQTGKTKCCKLKFNIAFTMNDGYL